MTPARRLPVVLLVLAVWGAIVPYVGPHLGEIVNTRPLNEIVDHVVPGAVVAGVAVVAWAWRRFTLAEALLVVLSGAWMTATHVPLLLQVRTGEVDLGAALFHAAPGVAILLLGTCAPLAGPAARPSTAGGPFHGGSVADEDGERGA